MTGKIDWDVVRPELRTLSTGDLLGIIGRAYELLDAQDLPHVLGRWVPLEPLRAAEAVFGARSLAEKAEGQRDRHLAEVRSLTLSNAHLAALEDAATRDRQQRLRRPR
jgi:hypothetical protein